MKKRKQLFFITFFLPSQEQRHPLLLVCACVSNLSYFVSINPNVRCELFHNYPADTRRRFNVYKTSYRCWNDIVCLLGNLIRSKEKHLQWPWNHFRPVLHFIWNLSLDPNLVSIWNTTLQFWTKYFIQIHGI